MCWCGHAEREHLPDEPVGLPEARGFCLICWNEQRKNKPYRASDQRIWPRHRFNERPYAGHHLDKWSG